MVHTYYNPPYSFFVLSYNLQTNPIYHAYLTVFDSPEYTKDNDYGGGRTDKKLTSTLVIQTF